MLSQNAPPPPPPPFRPAQAAYSMGEGYNTYEIEVDSPYRADALATPPRVHRVKSATATTNMRKWVSSNNVMVKEQEVLKQQRARIQELELRLSERQSQGALNEFFHPFESDQKEHFPDFDVAISTDNNDSKIELDDEDDESLFDSGISPATEKSQEAGGNVDLEGSFEKLNFSIDTLAHLHGLKDFSTAANPTLELVRQQEIHEIDRVGLVGAKPCVLDSHTAIDKLKTPLRSQDAPGSGPSRRGETSPAGNGLEHAEAADAPMAQLFEYATSIENDDIGIAGSRSSTGSVDSNHRLSLPLDASFESKRDSMNSEDRFSPSTTPNRRVKSRSAQKRVVQTPGLSPILSGSETDSRGDSMRSNENNTSARRSLSFKDTEIGTAVTPSRKKDTDCVTPAGELVHPELAGTPSALPRNPSAAPIVSGKKVVMATPGLSPILDTSIVLSQRLAERQRSLVMDSAVSLSFTGSAPLREIAPLPEIPSFASLLDDSDTPAQSMSKSLRLTSPLKETPSMLELNSTNLRESDLKVSREEFARPGSATEKLSGLLYSNAKADQLQSTSETGRKFSSGRGTAPINFCASILEAQKFGIKNVEAQWDYARMIASRGGGHHRVANRRFSFERDRFEYTFSPTRESYAGTSTLKSSVLGLSGTHFNKSTTPFPAFSALNIDPAVKKFSSSYWSKKLDNSFTSSHRGMA